jgi:hypothetical protein
MAATARGRSSCGRAHCPRRCQRQPGEQRHRRGGAGPRRGSFRVLASLLVWLAVQVPRYRRSAGERRQQFKWLYTGASIFVVFVVAAVLTPGGSSGLGQAINNVIVPVGFAALPVCVGVAVLRYRLYDIDRIISRVISPTPSSPRCWPGCSPDSGASRFLQKWPSATIDRGASVPPPTRTKGQARACPDRTRAIPCNVRRRAINVQARVTSGRSRPLRVSRVAWSAALTGRICPIPKLIVRVRFPSPAPR